MKRIFILILVSMFQFCGMAQVKMYNESFYITKPVTLYYNVENLLTVVGYNREAGELKITSNDDQAEVIDNNNGTFSFKPVTYLPIVEITIEQGDRTSTDKFYMKRMSLPTTRINGKSSGVMSRGEFVAVPGIMLNYADRELASLKCEILGFRVTRIAKEEKYSIINEGARYSSETIELISNAEPEDIFLYEDIKCNCATHNVPVQLNPMVMRVR